MAQDREVTDQLEVLRRIADRGLTLAHRIDARFVDLFQYLLDEIERTKIQCEEAKISSLQESSLRGVYWKARQMGEPLS